MKPLCFLLIVAWVLLFVPVTYVTDGGYCQWKMCMSVPTCLWQILIEVSLYMLGMSH